MEIAAEKTKIETIFPIRFSRNLLSNGIIILPISAVSFDSYIRCHKSNSNE